LGTAPSLYSGKPVTIATGADNNHDGIVNDRPAGIARSTMAGPGPYQSRHQPFSRYLAFNAKERGEGHQRIPEFFQRSQPPQLRHLSGNNLFPIAWPARGCPTPTPHTTGRTVQILILKKLQMAHRIAFHSD
jgi:hypothetical protein